MYRTTTVILLLSFMLTGCLPAPYYQKEEAIPQNAWAYAFKPSFSFDITDTTIDYQPSFLIRHTQAYPYSNLWINVYIKTPGDSVIKKERINVVMAEPSGKWLGRGMGEIYEQRLPLKFNDSIRFNRKGTYQVSLEQNMRINPLPEILNVGLRVEKDVPRRK
jgi:gliding motility-associated lipoprotein GldH